MAHQFEFDGRGPSTAKLAAAGLAFLVVCSLLGWLMVARSQGSLDRRVQVSMLLSSVGDGLPPKSDVKFRGVLVGMVRSVAPATDDAPAVVHVDITPQRAQGIPRTVTARIVPSNAFAVSSVQLVDNGPAAPLAGGDVIAEDTAMATQLFQTTLAKLRALVAATSRPGSDRTIGLIRTLADATAGQGAALDTGARGMNRIVAEMNALSVEDTGPPTLKTWESAIGALRATAPELLDALHHAVVPMRTVAEQSSALTDLITGAGRTVGTLEGGMARHTDELLAISTQLTPVVGVLADNAAKFPAITLGVNNLVDKFFSELWTRTGTRDGFTFKLVVALAPLRMYVREDCPVYGELRGPSCDTAPETAPVVDTHNLPDPRNAADQVLLAPAGTPPAEETFVPLPAPQPAGTP